MTAVASPPTFPQISRPAWGTISGNNPMNPDDVRGLFGPRNTLSRSNSSSSTSSASSAGSNTTVATNGSQSNGTALSAASDLSQWSANPVPRKRPQQPKPYLPSGKPEPQPDFSRLPPGGRAGNMAAPHGSLPPSPGQGQMAPQAMMRPAPVDPLAAGQPVLFLLSLNGTFERKTIAVPFAPDSLRIGRQTNQKTVPTSSNGFFDSKVLSRQHAEIYAERNGKIYIRDVKSSNGTFVNGTRLSQENRESEPHELQTADHLELGIDIVSEDQKTVVHHKVAAKVEHAGFMSPSNNVLDMSFGDLDPANNSMMPSGAVQMRGRPGSAASMTSNGRMMQNGGAMNGQLNGMPQQRPFFLAPIATDQILKRIANEMRSARIQSQDLNRTNQFVSMLLSKDDVKDLEKPEAPEPRPHPMVNGHGVAFRSDPKARFSDPPAPPPQQPLPEKPDVPSLKRGPTERPKSGAASPVRDGSGSQIRHLTEALKDARRDIELQATKVRELQIMLDQEREARHLAEAQAKTLGDSAHAQMNGSAKAPLLIDEADVDEAHDVTVTSLEPESAEEVPSLETAKEAMNAMQVRITTMDEQMREMRSQMEQWRQRCEVAESERDADRKTLAEMVTQLRAEEARRQEQEKRRSRSRRRTTETQGDGAEDVESSTGSQASAPGTEAEDGTRDLDDDSGPDPTLSRANTITPLSSAISGSRQEHRLQAGLPYASMMGVVLIGMGLMVYINGWQAPPPRVER